MLLAFSDPSNFDLEAELLSLLNKADFEPVLTLLYFSAKALTPLEATS